MVAALFRVRGVPVLTYHAVAEEGAAEARPFERKYRLGRTRFVEHLERIGREGYRVLSLDQLSRGENGSRSVVLTFDDGNASDYRVVFTLLVQRELTAAFFISTSQVGGPGFVTWSELRDMKQAGMSIQSHGSDHVDLRRLSAPTLREQLGGSKRLLEDRLGAPVDFLAVPYGLVDGQILDLAEAEGYRAVCTSRSWPARPGSRVVSRVAVYARTSGGDLNRLLSGRPAAYAARSLRAAIIHVPRALLLRWLPQALGVSVPEERS